MESLLLFWANSIWNHCHEEPKANSHVALPHRKPWIGWRREATHQLGSWTVPSCTRNDGQAKLKTRPKNWPHGLAALPDTKEKLYRDELPPLAVTPVPDSSSVLVGFWIISLMCCNNQLFSLKSEEYFNSLCMCHARSQDLPTIWKQITSPNRFLPFHV